MNELFEFLKRTKAREDECLIWTGGLNMGYGYYNRYIERYTHRFMYSQIVGELIPDLVIDHLCNNRACVNPWHLQQINRIDNWNRVRDFSNACQYGHEFTEENTYYNKPEYKYGRECRTCSRWRALARYYGVKYTGVDPRL